MWDVAALSQAMSAEQLRAWLEYASIEPFGDVQADLRAGTLARLVAEPNRDRSAHPEPFTALDFVPWLMTEERLAARNDPESHRVYADGEAWPTPTESQAEATERRALLLAGLSPEEIEDLTRQVGN